MSAYLEHIMKAQTLQNNVNSHKDREKTLFSAVCTRTNTVAKPTIGSVQLYWTDFVPINEQNCLTAIEMGLVHFTTIRAICEKSFYFGWVMERAPFPALISLLILVGGGFVQGPGTWV